MSSGVPESVAIIMDGNGRWAQRRHLPRVAGHRAGAQTVDRIVEHAARRGVKALTLYAFSTENWQRPDREVNALWRLLVRDLRQRGPKCLREGIRLTAIGRRDRMPERARAELARVERETAHCEKMTLFLALDYGGSWDIVHMAEQIRQMVHSGEINGKPLDERDVEALLGSSEVPPVDLLIRTGGDSRISNFLPWQLRYAELMFEPTFWPDFDTARLDRAFDHFASIHRRYGRIEEKQQEPVQAS